MPGAGPRRKTRKTNSAPPRRRPGRPGKGGVVTWTRQNGDVGYGVRFTDQHGARQYERARQRRLVANSGPDRTGELRATRSSGPLRTHAGHRARRGSRSNIRAVRSRISRRTRSRDGRQHPRLEPWTARQPPAALLRQPAAQPDHVVGHRQLQEATANARPAHHGCQRERQASHSGTKTTARCASASGQSTCRSAC